MPAQAHWVRAAILAAHGVVGWGLCGAIIGVGRRFFSMDTTLLLHAAGAPLVFVLLSLLYFRKFAYTGPAQTAAWFLAIVIGLDLFLVAPVFEKSYAMFASLLGTWLPFALIFAAVYLTGHLAAKLAAR